LPTVFLQDRKNASTLLSGGEKSPQTAAFRFLSDLPLLFSPISILSAYDYVAEIKHLFCLFFDI